MKQFWRKLNKSGFSLVEVIVTIAIVVVLIAPIMQNFIQSIKVNAKSQRLQDATALAQAVAESFKVCTLDELVSAYGSYTEDSDGAIYFNYIGDRTTEIDGTTYNYFLGAADEMFFVSVKLDPNLYTTANSYVIPDVNDLYATTAEHAPIVIKNEINSYDSVAYLNLGLGTDSSDIVKTTDVSITATEYANSSNENIYQVSVTLTVTYEYNGLTYTPVDGKTIQSYFVEEDDEMPLVYVCYTGFDTESTDKMYQETSSTGVTTSYYASDDVLNINYDYNDLSGVGEERELALYVANQVLETESSAEDSPKYMVLDTNKVSLPTSAYVTTYTNIYDYRNYTGTLALLGSGSISSGGTTIDVLYDMTVTVWYKDPTGEAFTTFKDASKENS